ncbi:MAG: hypothetical protein RR466_02100, partial [Hungatella sp.]
TRLIVEDWMARYTHIHYIRIPSTWHANRKVMSIFEQYGLEQTYDYLWVSGDAIRFSESVMRQVVSALERRYDMMIVNGVVDCPIGTREYTDANELFQDCACHTILFGGVILNVHTMLAKVPWRKLQEKYEIPERINYSHVGLYFEVLCRLHEFRALHLSVGNGLRASVLKDKSGWYQEAFQVICEYWPSTINALPQYYTNKIRAMNKLGYYSCFTPSAFLSYRKGKVYNLSILLKYRKTLEGMSGFDFIQLLGLLYLKPRPAVFFANRDFKGYVKELRKEWLLRIFCRVHSVLYIYGAGVRAVQYARYLQEKGIKLQGFIVTAKDGNPDLLLECPVITLAELGKPCGRLGIIMGLSRKNLDAVEPVLKKLNMWQNTYHEDLKFF